MGLFSVNKVIVLGSRIFDYKTPTVPVVAGVTQKSPGISLPVDQPFPAARPEDVGVSSASVEQFLSELASDKTLDMHTVLIIKDGHVICRAAFGPYDFDLPSYTFSACKSVASLAIGILVDENRLSLDERLIDIFQDETPAMGKFRLKELTVRNLLTMQSGVTFNEASSMTDIEWTKSFLGASVKGDPGKTFSYNSLNSYMLSCIVKKRSGKNMLEFLDSKIFKHLGISNVYWEKSPEGIEKGGWGLYIRPEDMAKLAQLVLDKGVWNGKRVISEQYINAATTPQVSPPESYGDFNYGYHIWVGRNSDSFLFNGMFGQNTLCYRQNRLIIVSSAGNGELFQQSNYFTYADKHFLRLSPSVKSSSAYDSLSKFVFSLSKPSMLPVKKSFLSLFTSKKALIPSDCSAVDRKEYVSPSLLPVGLLPIVSQVTNNCFTSGFVSVSFKIDNEKFYIIYREKDVTHVFPVGFGRFEYFDLSHKGLTFKCASEGRFAENEDELFVLKVKLYFLETPSKKVFKFIFDGKELTMCVEDIPGDKFVKNNARFFADIYAEKLFNSSFAEKYGMDFIGYLSEKNFSPCITLSEV